MGSEDSDLANIDSRKVSMNLEPTSDLALLSGQEGKAEIVGEVLFEQVPCREKGASIPRRTGFVALGGVFSNGMFSTGIFSNGMYSNGMCSTGTFSTVAVLTGSSCFRADEFSISSLGFTYGSTLKWPVLTLPLDKISCDGPNHTTPYTLLLQMSEYRSLWAIVVMNNARKCARNSMLLSQVVGISSHEDAQTFHSNEVLHCNIPGPVIVVPIAVPI